MDGKAKEFVKRLERISPFKSWCEIKNEMLLRILRMMILREFS